jgi:hypothetical protein
MNYAYVILDGIYQAYCTVMLESLYNHCECILLANTFKLDNKELLYKTSNPIIHFKISSEEWLGKRMFTKVERLTKMGFEYGDNVFILDTDIVVQDDIFAFFEKDFDVCYTSRHYNYYAPINAGVWGFKYNQRTKHFLEFYIEQMKNPTWEPYVKFREPYPNHRGLDWWCDQDFLCGVFLNGGRLPFDCVVVDMGPKYNFCPATPDVLSFEEARAEIMSHYGDKEYKILHFKSQLKDIMATLNL